MTKKKTRETREAESSTPTPYVNSVIARTAQAQQSDTRRRLAEQWEEEERVKAESKKRPKK